MTRLMQRRLPSTERERADDIRGFIRLSCLAYLTPLCLLFMYVDFVWYPAYVRVFAVIRFIELVLCFLLLRVAKSDRLIVMERWLSTYVLIVTGVIHFVLFRIGYPGTDYYAGLIMIPVGMAGELGSRWRCYAFNLAQVFVPYLAFGLLIAEAGPDKRFALNLLFMTSITVISTVGRLFARRLRERERDLRAQLQVEVEERDRIISAKTSEALELQQKRARLHEEIARANERMLVTEQVAHDIRSPLSALTITLPQAAGLSVEYRDLMRDAVGRIRTIADDLLSRARADRRRLVPEGPHWLSPLIERVVREKEMRHRDAVTLSLKLNAPGLVDTDAADFQRVISNLIDNAIEASAPGATVSISATDLGTHTLIEIQDHGRGIAPDVLPRLGTRGLSYGKLGGTGLGLFHAKTYARETGGTLKITSEPARGTTVSLVLRNAILDGVLIDVLDLAEIDCVVVLDDENEVAARWRHRLDLPVHYVATARELRAWMASRLAGERIKYLIDFDFGDPGQNGLELVGELGIAPHSVLVTGRAADEALRTAARTLGVRILTKRWIEVVPVVGGT